MRIAAAIFVAMHGAGHVVWFLSTWAQSALGKPGREELDRHRDGFVVQPEATAGKIVGIMSLVVIAGFAVTAWGIWIEASWWPPILVASALTSMIVILTMWNPIKRLSIRALLANVGLTAATFMPWGERFLGAH